MKNAHLMSVKKDIALLLRLLFITELTSSYHLAKKIFKTKNNYELRKKEVFIRKFLQRWADYDVIKIDVIDGRKYYSLNEENLFLHKGKIVLGNKKLDLGFVFGIKVNGSWIIFQLDKNYVDIIENNQT